MGVYSNADSVSNVNIRNKINANLFEDMNVEKRRFKESDEKLDILKDIRKNKKDLKKAKI
jgi:hypothetical protein